MWSVWRDFSLLVSVLVLAQAETLGSSETYWSTVAEHSRDDGYAYDDDNTYDDDFELNSSSVGGHTISALTHRRVEEDEDVEPVGWEQVDEKVVLCRKLETTLLEDAGGNLNSLRQHSVMCGELEFLAHWRMTRKNTLNKYMIVYKCCSTVPELGPCVEKKSPFKDSNGGSLLALKHHSAECGGNSLMKGWHMDTKGEKVRLRATCCSLAGKAKLGKCKDTMTQATTGSRDVRRMVKHDVKCAFPTVMTRWQMQLKGSSQIQVSFSCCAAGEVTDLPLGTRRTCRWVGDPHFSTFDGGRHDTTRPGSGQTFWIVKSKDVKVQSYYEGFRPHTPALTRGVVIFGRFLRGHKLIIKKDMPNIRPGAALLDMGGNESFMTDETLHSGVASVVTWDDKPVGKGQSIRVNGLCSIERKGNRVTASLPLGVQIDVTQHRGHQDQSITMAKAMGGQEGQCGNNNGNRGDDQNLEGRFPVPREENMFVKGGAGHGDQEKPQELSDCRADRRKQAEDACRKKFSGNGFLQDFLNMCIYDACFTNEGGILAKADKDAEVDAREGMEAQAAREFVVSTDRTQAGKVADTCTAGGKKVVKITSMDEQKAVMEAVANMKDSSDYLWAGGKFQGGRWVWNDGQEICGFQNWDPKVKRMVKKPPHNYLCISKRSGKWRMCSAAQQLNSLCSTAKVYAIQDFTGPVGARTACAPTHDLAMPKSAAEQEALMKAVRQHSGEKAYLWLGAAYRNERWEWDDGSKVCYTNWDAGEPKVTNESGQLWMVMKADTGKWSVLSGYEGFHNAPCETKMPNLPCVMSKLNPKELALSTIPGELYSSMRGHCYYMGKGGETCHETCWSQMGGYCDSIGMKRGATTKGVCKTILSRFGGNLGKNTATQKVVGNSGCTYMDMSEPGTGSKTQVIVAKGKGPPTCEARTTSKSHHRICACKDDLLLTYPLNHVVTSGDTVRVCGKGFNKKKVFKVQLKTFIDPDGGALLEGAVQPDQEVIEWLRWAETPLPQRWATGSRHSQAIAAAFIQARRVQSMDNSGINTSYILPGFEKDGWKMAVLLSSELPGGVADVGEARFNELFADCPIVMYFRDGHVHSVYKRLTDAHSVNAHSLFTGTWSSANNVLGKDFEIYGNLVDATRGENAWRFCNYDVPGVGYPRDCGPEVPMKDHWFAMPTGNVRTQGSSNNAGFQLFSGGTCPIPVPHHVATQVLDQEEVASLSGARWMDLRHNQAMQSSVSFNGKASKAVDGDKDPRMDTGRSCTHTDREANPWWAVDLQQNTRVIGIKVTNRADCCGSRLDPFSVYVGSQMCGQGRAGGGDGDSIVVPCRSKAGLVGSIVKIQLDKPSASALSLCEVEVAAVPDKPIAKPSIPAKNLILEHTSMEVAHSGTVSMSHGDDDIADNVEQGRGAQPTVVDWGEKQEQKTGGRVEVSLNFNPSKRIVTKKFTDLEGVQTSTVPWWDLDGSSKPWCVDLEADETAWKVRVNGKAFPELDIPRDIRKYITHVNTNAKSPHFMLIPPDPVSRWRPLSMNSVNGCMEHPFKASKQLMTFSFTVRPKQLSGSPCIRCESRPIDQGSHLYFHHDKLRLAVDGASPRIQTFRLKFQTNLKYKIDVVYISLENVVELYLNGLRVALLQYKKAPPFPLEPGLLGCATASKEDGRRLEGQIINFIAGSTMPLNRPKRDKCSGNAGLGVQCPKGYIQRENPSQIYCEGTVCTKADIDKCCLTQMKCDQYTCSPDTIKHLKASSTTCSTEQCRNDECCVVRAKCSTYTCPKEKGKILKFSPHMISCVGPKCTEEADMDACCDTLPKCESFDCPSGYSKIHSASQRFCADRACSSTSYQHCCAPNDKCAALACKSGYVLKKQAAQITCPGQLCKATDHDMCCEKIAPCQSMACRYGFVLHSDTSLLCKAGQCTTADDHNTCCVKKKTCKDFRCPPSWKHHANASEVDCMDEACKDTDIRHCCEERASCTTYTCPKHHVPRVDKKSLLCAGTTCTDAIDSNTCCQRLATCNTTLCQTGQVHVHNASVVLCDGPHCTQKDVHRCCVSQGLCTSLSCPRSHVHRRHAAVTFCHGDRCTDEDWSLCCDAKATCSEDVCERGYIMRPGIEKTLCQGTACGPVDHSTCCVESGRCGSLQCPNGTIPRESARRTVCLGTNCTNPKDIDVCCETRAPCDISACSPMHVLASNASELLCKSGNCTREVDGDTCCVEKGRCAAMTCPTGQELRPDARHRFCRGPECQNISQADLFTCCREVAKCSSYICPADMLPKPDARGALCKTALCAEHDRSTCCQPKTSCARFSCPKGTALRSDAEVRLCEDIVCKDTDWKQCCVEDGRCPSLHCTSDNVLRLNASNILCAGSVCTSDDHDTCCEPVASCVAEVCPVDMVLKSSLYKCQGNSCGHQDIDTCCRKRGTCDSYTCPPLYTLKATPHQLLCDDAYCINTHFNTCCDRVAHCSTYRCPVDFAPKESSATIPCAGKECTHADLYTCCDRRSDCSSMRCPVGYTNVHNASSIKCRGPECQPGELEKCCALKHSCTSLACPLGFRHRQGARQLTCKTETCTEADSELCCEHRRDCHGYNCPRGMVVHNDGICASSTCAEEECCVAAASCDSHQCPSGRVHATNAAGLYCGGTRCTQNDTNLCCTPLGTCAGFICPEADYILRPDAKHVLCSTPVCQKADFQVCCALKSHCSSLTCPSGYVAKANVSSIICEGDACTSHDRDVCCVKRAMCTSSYPHCPPGKTLTVDSTALCHGSKCTIEDQGLCCDMSATCDTFDCPHGYTQRFNAQDLWCNGRSCNASEYNKCCMKAEPCSNFTCPSRFIQRQNAASLHCEGYSCRDVQFGDLNLDRCCEPKATCDSLACKEHYVHHRDAAHTTCGSHNCTETDASTCCVEVSDCRSFRCPLFMVPRIPVGKTPLYCEGTRCTIHDRGTCCVERMPCNTEACQAGYALRPDHHDKLCKNATCNSKDDNGICCSPRASCSDFQCPVGYGVMSQAWCRGITCEQADYRSCCRRRDHCDAVMCPAGLVNPLGAADIPCGTKNCTSADTDTCCVPVANCSTYECPVNFTKKADESSRHCKWGTCSDADVLTCCYEEAMCSNYTCGDGLVQRPNAANIECSESDCANTDAKVCCAVRGMCDSLACPVGLTHRSNASSVNCTAGKSDCSLDADMNTCCEVAAACDTLECPSEYLHVDYPEYVACASSRCSVADDLNKCCLKRGLCESYHCPTGKSLRQSHRTLTCADSNCSEGIANEARCCAEIPMCSTLPCPGHHYHIEDADFVRCSGEVCGDVDRGRCCVSSLTTTTSTKPTLQAQHVFKDVRPSGSPATSTQAPHQMRQEHAQGTGRTSSTRRYSYPAMVVLSALWLSVSRISC
mmetsp:Transcript_40716/g.93622  ORF Transcript_40716/g.93622 Transcript_40716/m.93622 type:complete len:3363 (+) Transcript_40716:123-10211(+)